MIEPRFLKAIRIILLFSFMGALMLVLIYGGHTIRGGNIIIQSFPANIQVGPALVRLATAFENHITFYTSCLALLAVMVATCFFGRWYCATLCPMGALQDCVIWIRKRWKKPTFQSIGSLKNLRWFILGLIVFGLLQNHTFFYTLFEPYAVSTRALSVILEPLGRYLNHQSFEIPFFLNLDWALPAFIWAAFFVLLSFFYGRLFCNHLCPVGPILNLITRKSRWKLQISHKKCLHCGKCNSLCRASCISSDNQHIDFSECVLCMDCLSSCPVKAISYTKVREAFVSTVTPFSPTRRWFIRNGLGLILVATWIITEPILNRSYLKAVTITISGYKRQVALPPGAGSFDRFARICVGCSLCVAVCPSGVIRLGTNIKGLSHPFIALLNYEGAYCQYDCHACMLVCPTGALSYYSLEEKKLLQLGKSRFVRGRCIMVRKERYCGACAEHCPTGAITLVSTHRRGQKGFPEPSIREDKCIGCGACETVCPAHPKKAIFVEGLAIQTKLENISAPTNQEESIKKDFPF